ncbi:MAG: exodeoxyribonuclease VII small subunit [Parasphingorhabdus sp.]|jgi:exodeoxyribonuclease VII small subunit
MATSKSKASLATFEKNYAELEKIVERMESGELSLDQSIKDFEQGMNLCNELRNALNRAEQKVQILVQKKDQDVLEDFSDLD